MTEGNSSTTVGNAIEPVGAAVPATGTPMPKAKEATQITTLLDQALADTSLSPATRGHITEARRIADDVVDGRTVSTEEQTRKRRKAKAKKAGAKKSAAKKSSARKSSSKRAAKRR
jgi:hypothetical protein